MPSCEPHIFSDVTPEMLACLSESAQSAFGLSLDGNQGTTTAMGTTLSWDYNPETRELTIICSAKPMFLSCEMVYGQIGSMLKKCS